jgi:hypothetical protein
MDSATDASASVGTDEGGAAPDAGGATTCDPRKVLCRAAPPTCGTGMVPSVLGSCYGPCVPIEQCTCAEAAACPDSNQYTCHMNVGQCGPYVN